MKGWPKLNIQKTKIMASGPITSWQIDGEKMETVTDFIILGSKITADGDWSSDVCSSDLKRQRNQRSNSQHLLDHGKSKRVPEKHLFLLY